MEEQTWQNEYTATKFDRFVCNINKRALSHSEISLLRILYYKVV